MSDHSLPEPGLIILFGSGETSPTGRKIFEYVFHSLPKSPKIALLETPAGFELNSHQVIQRVADFFSHQLLNFSPQVKIVPARKRGTCFSPDKPDIVAPILDADLIFMGPGSPSYTIRQLRDSLAWHYLFAHHRQGGAIALASAASIALSAYALPVYEIYKVGEDLHWIEGLNFFHHYGLDLIFIPHWNNHEGGAELDTSRCFMGKERFTQLIDMLPDDMTIIGLDEKTALIIDPSTRNCQVTGLGQVTLMHTGQWHSYNDKWNPSSDKSINDEDTENNLVEITRKRGSHILQFHDGQIFPISEIGSFHPCHPDSGLPPGIWLKAMQAKKVIRTLDSPTPSEEVLRLIEARDKALKCMDWSAADEYRLQIEHLGWEVMDTKDGPVSRKIQKATNNY